MVKARISGIIGIIASLAFVALGVYAILFVLNDIGAPPAGEGDPGSPEVQQELTVKDFSEYTWDEVAQIAALMEASPDEAQGRDIAAHYGLIESDGSLTSSMHRLELANGVVADVRLVGVFHDIDASTGRKAALTFMVSPIDMRRVNPEASSAGGWAGSELRAWLNGEALELFPDDLVPHIVTVRKTANNTGKTSDVAAVSPVDDTLWLFSCREVCGEITWLADEFDYLSSGEDAMLNAEGTQYEAFIQAGVDQHSDSASYLVMYLQGKAVPWWYRTPYAFEFLATTDDTFYQVTSSGYARAVNVANDQAGIVVGFCL